MRVVLDTVILVRGLINPYSVWGRLVFDYATRYRWIISEPIEAEYLDVLSQHGLVRKYRMAANRDLAAIKAQLATATVVTPSDVPAVCRDPEDDMFIAAALAGSAQFIVSEDRDLLDLNAYQGVRIASAETFLQLLGLVR